MTKHILGKRIGVLVAAGAVAVLATACESKDADAKSSGSTSTTAAAPGTGGETPAGGKADGTAKPEDKGDAGSKGGDKGKYAAELNTYLKTTSQAAHVLEVRAEKQMGTDYTVTINTSLDPADGAALEQAAASMDAGEKLTNAAEEWIQAHGDLKVVYIEVLDKNKGTVGNENLDNKPKDKAANQAYAAEVLAALKATANGAQVEEVFVFAGPVGAKLVVDTAIAAENGDVDADLARMEKAEELAKEALQYVQDHTQVKVTYIEILDTEKGLAGNENV
ncbi:hypothetical protein [Yinghuangia soli]|uniref:Lipoprotein n=1 Tax=Yinghuangia soli TaxID=2908204 RepID=A0AA41Q876_9ACTN|nr:hypothetical protein [Yinghuangia soli]MCF2531987.1 hypothetical protein [Yinghuangia soli]